MKLNTAFNILLAVICTVSRAHARVPSRLRDPRTVEEKEQVHRQTMGDYVTGSLLRKKACTSTQQVFTSDSCPTCQDRLEGKEAELRDDADLSPEKAKSLACTAVSNEFEVCQGCQGFSQVDKEVHIPGCVGMTSEKCKELAALIVQDKPDWFKDGKVTSLVPEEYDVSLPSEMAYYKVGLPVSADDDAAQGSKVITGVAGDCMVHYPWDWCVDMDGSAACLKLPPWDCSTVGGACLSSYDCCAQIQDEYPGQDINGNELLCYEWVLPGKSSGVSSGNTDTSGVSDGNSSGLSIIGSSGGVTGNRLIIHLNDGKVAVPAVITDGNYKVVHDEDIIEPKEVENSVTQQGCTSTSTNQRFLDQPTLKDAVKAYVSQNCAAIPADCAIGVKYGWPINTWCVEKVTSFDQLFYGLTTFNEDVNGWTTSQVVDMDYTFFTASAFNQPLDNWDVSSVTTMQQMFSQASAFNQPLNNWDVSSVTNMYSVFSRSAFNQPLNNWDVSQVTDMENMFYGTGFNQPLNNWDVSKVSTMSQMFRGGRFNQPLNNWDTSSVTHTDNMFRDAIAFSQDLCHFGDHYESPNLYGSNVNYNQMFQGTNCPNKESPTSADGPWCVASCLN